MCNLIVWERLDLMFEPSKRIFDGIGTNTTGAKVSSINKCLVGVGNSVRERDAYITHYPVKVKSLKKKA